MIEHAEHFDTNTDLLEQYATTGLPVTAFEVEPSVRTQPRVSPHIISGGDIAFVGPCLARVPPSPPIPVLSVRELDSAEFPSATEVWRDYYGTWGDPTIDRVFALFADWTLSALAMCRRHPDGCEVDAVYTPVPYRGRGYARRVMAGLVEACHDEDLYMYAVTGLEPFYASFGFTPITEDDLPPTIRARYDWTVGGTEAAKITPMLRSASRSGPFRKPVRGRNPRSLERVRSESRA